MAVSLRLSYGNQFQGCSIPEFNFAGSLCPQLGRQSEPLYLLGQALNHPIQSEPARAFLNGRSVLIIVNDASRSTPTSMVLDVLLEDGKLNTHGWQFLVATGSHQPPASEDLKFLFGSHYHQFQSRIHIHSARDASQLSCFGQSAFGNDIWLNRMVKETDAILIIGSVEPHYFAGFTGGRKAFLPGIAGMDCIASNHRLAMEPGVDVMALDGNPVHQEMDSVVDMIDVPVFSVQLVLNPNDDIVFAAAGDLCGSFDAAVSFCRSFYACPVAEPADVVIACMTPPLDVSLYQAHKGIENTRGVLKERGILILLAPCQNGVGDNARFVNVLKQTKSPADVLTVVQGNYVLGDHKAARLAQLMQRGEVWAVSELPQNLLREIFFSSFSSLQAAVDAALQRKPHGRVLVVEAAGMTVPVAGGNGT